MKQVRPGVIVVLILLTWAARGYAASGDAAVSGVVRDMHGVPQMGALIELLTADATTVASALSDDHGRYIMPAVTPGKYELRATAAFFVPLRRTNLSLHAGTQAIVNLTMSTLFEAGNWLPAEKRSPDEPADDWKWTLRSTASRPLLRLTDPDTGLEISTSAAEAHKAETQARMSVLNGDGAFAYGGMHQVLTMDRAIGDGDVAILRADLGDPQSPLTVAPSLDVLAGYQRQLPLGGRTRLVTSYSSQPELMTGGVPGFEVLRMASAEEISLGDAIMIDAGTLLQAERLEYSRITSEPYARITVRPGEDVAVEFRYATGRLLQSADDLDRLRPETTVLADQQGRPLSDKGSHEELVISRKLNDNVISVSVYRDGFQQGALAGSGAIDGADMEATPLVSDPTTATFRLATGGYTAHGVNAAVTHSFTPVLQAKAEYDFGTALRSDSLGPSLPTVATHTEAVSAAKVELTGKIQRSGTSVTAEYRWQPLSSLTQVDAYDATPDEAYLSFALRQRIWGGWFLPHGMDAVVEATNLLEQGYQPVLAPDGHTLFLAQVPRAIQCGLAFNF